MEIRAIDFFNQVSEQDLIDIAQAGKLYDLCRALSLDLESSQHISKYEA